MFFSQIVFFIFVFMLQTPAFPRFDKTETPDTWCRKADRPSASLRFLKSRITSLKSADFACSTCWGRAVDDVWSIWRCWGVFFLNSIPLVNIQKTKVQLGSSKRKIDHLQQSGKWMICTWDFWERPTVSPCFSSYPLPGNINNRTALASSKEMAKSARTLRMSFTFCRAEQT